MIRARYFFPQELIGTETDLSVKTGFVSSISQVTANVAFSPLDV